MRHFSLELSLLTGNHIGIQVERIGVDEESLALLGSIGESTALRHAAQLMTPAQMLAKSNGRDEITTADVDEVHELFHHAKFTARLLAEQADKYVS